MLGAMVRLQKSGRRPRPTVVMACTVNEEHGFTGATGLCQLWSGESESDLSASARCGRLLPSRRICNVVVAHKGMVRWRCRTRGRAAHSSQPEHGENAIFRMARVLGLLEHYHAKRGRHAGRASAVRTADLERGHH